MKNIQIYFYLNGRILNVSKKEKNQMKMIIFYNIRKFSENNKILTI